MQGFLQQRRRDGSWMQLYCRLKDGSMLLYRGVLDDKPVVSFAVKDYSLTSPDPGEAEDKPFAFKLNRPGVSQHVLAAEDEAALQKWIKGFTEQNVNILLNVEDFTVKVEPKEIVKPNFDKQGDEDIDKWSSTEDNINGALEEGHLENGETDPSNYNGASDLLLDFTADSFQPPVSEEPFMNLGKNFDSSFYQLPVIDEDDEARRSDSVGSLRQPAPETDEDFPVHFSQKSTNHVEKTDEETLMRFHDNVGSNNQKNNPVRTENIARVKESSHEVPVKNKEESITGRNASSDSTKLPNVKESFHFEVPLKNEPERKITGRKTIPERTNSTPLVKESSHTEDHEAVGAKAVGRLQRGDDWMNPVLNKESEDEPKEEKPDLNVAVKSLDKKLFSMFERNDESTKSSKKQSLVINRSSTKSKETATGAAVPKEHCREIPKVIPGKLATPENWAVNNKKETESEEQIKTESGTEDTNSEQSSDVDSLNSKTEMTVSNNEPLDPETELRSCKDAMKSAKNIFLQLENLTQDTWSAPKKINLKSQKSHDDVSYFKSSVGTRVPLLSRTKSEPALNKLDEPEVVYSASGKYAEQSKEKEVLSSLTNPFLARCRLKQKVDLEKKLAAAQKESAQRVEDLTKQVADQENDKRQDYTIVRVGSYVQALPLRRSDALPRRLAEEEKKHNECVKKLEEVRAEIRKLTALAEGH